MHFYTFFSGFSRLKSLAQLVLLLTVGLGFFQSVAAQQLRDLEYTELPAPSTIPIFASNPDDAAIIITSSLPNLRFESNVGIVADQSNAAAGEYRLVILPFRQSITVQAPGFKQLRITVQVTQAKEVKYYSIEPVAEEEEEDTTPIQFQVSPIEATLDPSSFNVFVDGQPVDIKTPTELSYGTHELVIESFGYKTIEETFEVDGSRIIYPYVLEQLQELRYVITSNPDQASVEIDGISQSRLTNFDGFLFPGDYFVRVSKPGYKVEQRTITIDEASNNNFIFTLEEFSGDLRLNLTPSNARVLLNQQPVQVINGVAKVQPGQYSMRVEAPGYDPQTLPIRIEDGEIVERTIVLNQIVGSLRVNSNPFNATITLVDRFGNTYLQREGSFIENNVPEGSYTIRATAPQHNDYTSTVFISRNQQTVFDLEMISFSQAEIAERERQAQLQRDREALAASREEQRRKDAARERRASVFKRPTFGGMYFHYNLFELDGTAFSTNVDESYGLGLGFFKYKNYKTTSFDFVYNSYTLISGTTLPDEIISYNLTGAFVPTLPIGPFLIGYGVGVDFTQYEDTDALSYYYTTDAFLAFQLTFMPRSWNLGFMIDNRRSWDIGLADVYNPWTQVKYSLILSFN